MFCINGKCRARIEDDDPNFCPVCGTDIRSPRTKGRAVTCSVDHRVIKTPFCMNCGKRRAINTGSATSAYVPPPARATSKVGIFVIIGILIIAAPLAYNALSVKRFLDGSDRSSNTHALSQEDVARITAEERGKARQSATATQVFQPPPRQAQTQPLINQVLAEFRASRGNPDTVDAILMKYGVSRDAVSVIHGYDTRYPKFEIKELSALALVNFRYTSDLTSFTRESIQSVSVINGPKASLTETTDLQQALDEVNQRGISLGLQAPADLQDILGRG